MLYGFLSFIGAIPIPKLYIIANFYLNKNHFERLVYSDINHCSNFSGEIESYISNTDDEELQKSMKVLFKGIWRANFQENTMANNVAPNIGQHVTELRNVHIDILN